MPMFNTNLYSNDGSVLYGNDGSYDFGFTITINKNSVGTGFSYAENGATIDSGNLNLPFDILGLTLTKGKQTPDDGLYVGDTDSQYDGLKNGELNLYVVPVPDIKTVSSENLARFKAKCDETYQKKGSGGITNAEVIEYAEQLPTATETSPNFVQTPDGTLYRKKAVGGGSLLGTWVIHEGGLQIFTNYTFAVSFTSNENSYNSLKFEVSRETVYVKYDSTTVATGTVSAMNWTNDNYRTITITDTSSLTNVEEFTTLMGNIAIQTGGGASVSYEYVAMQEVPTPTTADNGKVLGVANGQYALQEASGGGGTTGYTVNLSYVTCTILYSDNTTEAITESEYSFITKNNVKALLNVQGTNNMWTITNAIVNYNNNWSIGISENNTSNVGIVIPLTNECVVETFPD